MAQVRAWGGDIKSGWPDQTADRGFFHIRLIHFLETGEFAASVGLGDVVSLLGTSAAVYSGDAAADNGSVSIGIHGVNKGQIKLNPRHVNVHKPGGIRRPDFQLNEDAVQACHDLTDAVPYFDWVCREIPPGSDERASDRHLVGQFVINSLHDTRSIPIVYEGNDGMTRRIVPPHYFVAGLARALVAQQLLPR